MIDTKWLRASDATGNAVLAHITANRLVASTTIVVDSVAKFPAGGFILTTGTLLASGYINPATQTEMRAHIVGANIIIDSFEPGYADVGNTNGQVAIIKQTTGFANLVQDALAELQTEDITRHSRTFSDFIQSGGVWSVVAGLNGAMTGITAYQAGIPGIVAAIVSRAYTASKDTYVDVLRTGTSIAPIFTIVYTEVANGVASPALAANSIRLAVVVTSGAAITTITQVGFDSLGNRINPTTAVNPLQPKIWWEELGRTTLTVAGDLISVANIPPRKYLMMIYNVFASGGAIDTALRFNNDAGNNYSWYYLLNLGNSAGGTSINAANIPVDANSTAAKFFGSAIVSNVAGREKFVIIDTTDDNAVTGAGALPTSLKVSAKWANAVNAINRIDFVNTNPGDFAIGSELIILGHD